MSAAMRKQKLRFELGWTVVFYQDKRPIKRRMIYVSGFKGKALSNMLKPLQPYLSNTQAHLLNCQIVFDEFIEYACCLMQAGVRYQPDFKLMICKVGSLTALRIYYRATKSNFLKRELPIIVRGTVIKQWLNFWSSLLEVTAVNCCYDKICKIFCVDKFPFLMWNFLWFQWKVVKQNKG